MSLSLIVLFLGSFVTPASQACTTVAIPSAENIVGKSYDWSHGHGLLMVNKRQVQKESIVFKEKNLPVQWVSQYGSLTFNQHGLEFPLEGMNEKGVIVQVLWLSGSIYPEPSDAVGSLNELQWIQYILDTSDSVSTAIQKANDVKVENTYADVHYFVCDAKGACATFEYLNGNLVIHTGKDLPIRTLANNTYQDSLSYLKLFKGFGGDLELPKAGDIFTDRFVTATVGAMSYTPEMEIVDYTFSLLNTVDRFGWTKWQSVYLPKSNTVLYRTPSNDQIRKASLNSFDLRCKTPVKVFDIHERGEDISFQFQTYTDAINQGNIDQNTYLGQNLRALMGRYPAEYTRCVTAF